MILVTQNLPSFYKSQLDGHIPLDVVNGEVMVDRVNVSDTGCTHKKVRSNGVERTVV